MDIVIRGGTVIDGTGKPGYVADVGIKDGLIVAVGQIAERGREEIDASNQIVTPGFVDLHTHYDGQATWDNYFASSSWHGVTTVLMGNCGVGFAPCKPENRQSLIDLMEGVEDIPAPALHEGLDWQWESFGEFLDRLESKPHDIDYGVLLPHSAVRIHAMGKRASYKESATPEEIAKMRQIAKEAVLSGAFGFSTSRATIHKTVAGEITPSFGAEEKELIQIALGMREAGSGMLEFTSDWTLDPKAEFGLIRDVAEKSGLRTLYSLVALHAKQHVWKELLALSNDAAKSGVPIRPVFPPRGTGVLFGLQGTQNPFSACPTYKALADLPVKERAEKMRDPKIREKILSEDPIKGSVFAAISRMKYEYIYPLDSSLNYEPSKDMSLAEIAKREGRTPPEVAYDLLIANDGRDFILLQMSSYPTHDLSFSETMLREKNSIVGLGDGGAHVGYISDASFSTFLLTHWGRDRPTGRFPLEELVRRQTSDTANAIGLYDRGVIALGKKADINVIDFKSLRIEQPYVVHDLPGKGRRFLQKATGYTVTIKSGAISYRNGVSTGILNGRLLRGGPAIEKLTSAA